MKRMIAESCKQAFFSPAFLLSAAGTALVLLLGITEELLLAFRSGGLLSGGYHMTLLEQAMAAGPILLALPVLSALPFTASYIDDIRSGFIKESLPRTRVSHYLFGKIAACMLSGGLAIVLGVFLALGLLALGLTPKETALPQGAAAVDWLAPLLRECVPFFCSGAFWALVGMTLSAVTGSKYMAYLSPFVLYYVLVILCERYFTSLSVFYPKQWLQPRDWPGNVWGAALLLLELSLVWGIGFYAAAKRRLEGI